MEVFPVAGSPNTKTFNTISPEELILSYGKINIFLWIRVITSLGRDKRKNLIII